MEFETFDPELMNMINVMTQHEVTTNRGTFTPQGYSWGAQFTEEGSGAIRFISYNEEEQNLSVEFSTSNVVYNYVPLNDSAEQLRKEALSVIQDNQGSIGTLLNQLLRNNQLQLL